MYAKLRQPERKGGYIQILESYRDDSGKPRTRTVMSCGYVDDLKKEYDDPLAHFKDLAIKMTKEKKENRSKELIIDMQEDMAYGKNIYNVGYLAFRYIYDELGITELLNNYSRNTKIAFSLNKNLELLAYSRLLDPKSKRSTYQDRHDLFEGFDKGVTKDSIYDCLDHFDILKEKIQSVIWNKTKDSYQRETDVAFYDCSNYYFEIEYNDEDEVDDEGNIIRAGLRKREPEKNKRPDPIVEMGLLMDKSFIPLAYDIFPGNESEKLSFRPIRQRVRRDYDIGRCIYVADRGLNTSDNIFFLSGKNDTIDHDRDGYVYGQSVRGASKEFKDWVLEDGYKVDIINEEGEEIAFVHKSRVIAKEIKIEKDGKRNVKVNVCQKQMVYFSFKYMMKQRRDRQKMIEKAEDIIKNPSAYTKATSYGAAYYIDDIAFDKETGEIKTDKILKVDHDKVKEEEKYDGYYAIVTSEIEYDDYKIREIYRGLAKIEETFKITKSYLKGRPVFVWTYEHIQGHFLICFIALVLERLLERRLGNRYPSGKIIEAIRNYNCTYLKDNIYQFLYYDEIIADIAKSFSIDLSRHYRSKEEIRRLLRY